MQQSRGAFDIEALRLRSVKAFTSPGTPDTLRHDRGTPVPASTQDLCWRSYHHRTKVMAWALKDGARAPTYTKPTAARPGAEAWKTSEPAELKASLWRVLQVPSRFVTGPVGARVQAAEARFDKTARLTANASPQGRCGHHDDSITSVRWRTECRG